MANVVQYVAKDGQEVRLTFDDVKKFLVHGKPELVTNQEMIFFIGICKARGLNPFAKDCYLIKYSNDPAAIVTSIDFFRSRARAQKDCKGWQSGIIVEDKEGNLRYSKGILRKGEELLGGWFKARPEGWEYDFELEVNLDGYIKKTKDGNITKFWQKENQPTMIRKVTESQGLRELWPDEFAKIYVDEEVDREEMRESFFGQKAPMDMKKESDQGKDIYAVNGDPEKEPDKPPEGQQPKPDPTEEIIAQFKNKQDKGLLEWEAQNRKVLSLMNVKVQAAFMDKWKRTFGQDYAGGGPPQKDESEKVQNNGRIYLTCPASIDSKQPRKAVETCDKCDVKGHCSSYTAYLEKQDNEIETITCQASGNDVTQEDCDQCEDRQKGKCEGWPT